MKKVLLLSFFMIFIFNSCKDINSSEIKENIIKGQNITEEEIKERENIQKPITFLDEIWKDTNYKQNMEAATKYTETLSSVNISGYFLGEKFSNKGEEISNISKERFLKVIDAKDFNAESEEGYLAYRYYSRSGTGCKIAYGKNIALFLNKENVIETIVVNTTEKEIKKYTEEIITSLNQKNIVEMPLPSSIVGYNYNIYDLNLSVYENFKIISIESFKFEKNNKKSKIGEYTIFSAVEPYIPTEPYVPVLDEDEHNYYEVSNAKERYNYIFNTINNYILGTKFKISDNEDFKGEVIVGNKKYDIFSIPTSSAFSYPGSFADIWVDQQSGLITRFSFKYNNTEALYFLYKIYDINYYYNINPNSNDDIIFINNKNIFLYASNQSFDFFEEENYNKIDCFLNREVFEELFNIKKTK